MSFRFIDLFAGIGGFRIALSSVGGSCVFSSEWDQFSKKTYFSNFGDEPNGDITKISTSDIPDFEILTAGFPCQPFSSIGKRQGFEHPTQGTLFFDVLRIIKEKRPHAFILENVEGLVNHDGGNTLRIIIDSLAVSENGTDLLLTAEGNLGYHLFWKVLDAQYFGVPQTRKRIFIIGVDAKRYGSNNFSFPAPSTTSTPVGPYIQQNVTGYSISKSLQDTYLFKLNDGRPQIVTKESNFPVKTLVSTYHKIQRLTGTFVQDSGSETGIRLLSEMECKSIMTYPESFVIPVSRTQMYRQFGNSVAVNHVKKVAAALIGSLNK